VRNEDATFGYRNAPDVLDRWLIYCDFAGVKGGFVPDVCGEGQRAQRSPVDHDTLVERSSGATSRALGRYGVSAGWMRGRMSKALEISSHHRS
jgi:hypothetical protein